MDLEIELFIDKMLEMDYDPRSIFIKIMQNLDLKYDHQMFGNYSRLASE